MQLGAANVDRGAVAVATRTIPYLVAGAIIFPALDQTEIGSNKL